MREDVAGHGAAALAQARYNALIGIGGDSPKDSALLSWRSPSTLLLLQVFPVAHDTEKTIEYRLVVPDLVALLRAEVRAALNACGGDDRTAKVVLQTTRFEIVEVDDIGLAGPANATLSACLREAVWAFELPGEFTDEWRRWTIDL